MTILVHNFFVHRTLVPRAGYLSVRRTMKILLYISLCLLSYAAIANDEYIDLGDTKEKVIKIEGSPTSTTEMKDHNGVFLNLYYSNKDINYVIDIKKNLVCEIGVGNKPSTCYPCSGKNGEDLCI